MSDKRKLSLIGRWAAFEADNPHHAEDLRDAFRAIVLMTKPQGGTLDIDEFLEQSLDLPSLRGF